MQQEKNMKLNLTLVSIFTITFFAMLNVKAQVGQLLWEDNFDTFDSTVWNKDEGDGCNIGICGWGNAELQWYKPNNVYIEPIPGEPGNNALVLEAKNETLNSYSFTSGKVTTQENLSIHYGLIEVRVKVPDLETGLWPATWLLGTSNITWPAQGEIDMMEMGFKQSSMANQGYPNTSVNNYVGANAIFSNADGSLGSIAWDTNYNTPYVSSTPLNDKFVIYRLYWEPTQIRYTVEDNGIEHDLYAAPLPISANGALSEFTQPFYMLMNLAVGGNFTDASTNAQITAPLPAKMHIDYVKVFQWNGYGTVEMDYNNLQAESGTFGIYTENTATTDELTFGTDADIYVWSSTLQSHNNCAAPDGSSVLAWRNTIINNWFGAGVAALNGRNMTNYIPNGQLKFKIKIPADISFRIGITDNYSNESWLTFPAGQTTYGLVRNGEWGEVSIPLNDFAGSIAFQDIFYLFAISSDPNALPSYIFDMCIDDIVWEENDCNLNLNINGLPPSVGSNVPINLSATPPGGTFSGPGVIFSAFNPSIAGPGFHTITYNYTNENNCSGSTSQNILVFEVFYIFVNYNLGTVAPKIINDSELVITTKPKNKPVSYTVNVYDVNGMELYAQKITATQSNNQNTGIYPFKNLKKGIYIFTISNGIEIQSEKIFID